MGRPALELRAKRSLRERLRGFYLADPHPRAASMTALAQHLGVAISTVSGWFGPKPKTPELVHIAAMASKDHLNPNYLILGEGPELLGAPAPLPTVAEGLYGHLRATLLATTDAVDVDSLMPAGSAAAARTLLRDVVELSRDRLRRHQEARADAFLEALMEPDEAHKPKAGRRNIRKDIARRRALLRRKGT